ncbi:GNAT family N-acetyltransferase [Bradyrhizobium sp.]|uniref:GNAT family N-acetyltransferase n=1 Tax=Bradyrhizobium sp. TaxID=376 RepID=UPI003C52CD99
MMIVKPDVAEPSIRPAIAADVAAVTRIVADAYRHYIPRMRQTPSPMLDDYAERIAAGVVWVIEARDAVRGIVVLVPKPDHLLLENIAVDPICRGTGFGRLLLVFAEAEAIRRRCPEIRLYTHATMTENQRLYARIGYQETGRRSEAGYDRVFMSKCLT